jgi:uncharacterized membrane protein
MTRKARLLFVGRTDAWIEEPARRPGSVLWIAGALLAVFGAVAGRWLPASLGFEHTEVWRLAGLALLIAGLCAMALATSRRAKARMLAEEESERRSRQAVNALRAMRRAQTDRPGHPDRRIGTR